MIPALDPESVSLQEHALALAVGGVALARYAEADDAPGGVVIGWVLVIGAVALGVRALQQRKG
jgi:hypothetical protein